MTREPIYAALFSLLSGVADFVTVSRRLVHWADVPAAAQPAMFVAQKSEDHVVLTNTPMRLRLMVNVYIYVNAGNDPNATPATQLNNILDALDAAFKIRSPSENQTLGGLVSYCRIAGNIQTDEGVLGDQAIAIVPVEMMVNH